MLVGIAATKGSPGATTLSLALGLASGSGVLVEADPGGGSLAPRVGLRFDPGASSLAAAARHELTIELLAQHLQPIGQRLGALVAPSDPRSARHALGVLGERLARVLAQVPDVHAFFDLGRLDGDSPVRPLARVLDVVVLLAAPSLEGVDALSMRLGALEDLRERCVLITSGDGPYRPDECATALSLALGGHLPRDNAGSAVLWRDLALEGVGRRPLGRAIADIAGALGVLPTAAVKEVRDVDVHGEATEPNALETLSEARS